jgi:hypothetical protein
MIAIVYGGIIKRTRCAHGCTIALLAVAGAKRENAVGHDDVETLQDCLSEGK